MLFGSAFILGCGEQNKQAAYQNQYSPMYERYNVYDSPAYQQEYMYKEYNGAYDSSPDQQSHQRNDQWEFYYQE